RYLRTAYAEFPAGLFGCERRLACARSLPTDRDFANVAVFGHLKSGSDQDANAGQQIAQLIFDQRLPIRITRLDRLPRRLRLALRQRKIASSDDEESNQHRNENCLRAQLSLHSLTHRRFKSLNQIDDGNDRAVSSFIESAGNLPELCDAFPSTRKNSQQ